MTRSQCDPIAMGPGSWLFRRVVGYFIQAIFRKITTTETVAKDYIVVIIKIWLSL